MAQDDHLADLLAQAVSGRQGVSRRRMFGGDCWMLHGNLLCAARIGEFLFRVGKDHEEAVLTLPGVTPMINAGRRMGGFVWVDADAALDEGLEVWLRRAADYVGGLPPR
jgi:TfoX/Sxy family transcriptional regulator of competence genes